MPLQNKIERNEKNVFFLCETVTAKLISAFATQIVPCLYLNLKFQASMILQVNLCRTWLETPETVFLASQLNCVQLAANVLDILLLISTSRESDLLSKACKSPETYHTTKVQSFWTASPGRQCSASKVWVKTFSLIIKKKKSKNCQKGSK